MPTPHATPRTLGLLFALFLGTQALAAPPSASHEAQKRREAMVQVKAILGGAVLPGTSRLHFLGEERYAADLLARQVDAPDVFVRRNVAQALAQLAVAQSEAALVQLAQDEDAPVRMSAAQGLGRIHSRAVRVLRPLLQDKTLGVRREAARALGALHRPPLGRVLLAAARAEESLDARAQMLISVGESGDSRQAPGLERFLHSTSESTRLAAAQALCHLGAKAGLSYARTVLASPEPLDRRHGVELFEGTSARISRKLLRPMLEDTDAHIAALAARVLHEGGEKGMVEWLVLASASARGEARFPYEDQLERLQVTPKRRQAILKKAGLR